MRTFKSYLNERKNVGVANQPLSLAKPYIPDFLNKSKQVSTPEDKPQLTPVASPPETQSTIIQEPKPESKLIIMKGNTVNTGAPQRKQSQTQQASPMYTVGKNESMRQIAIRHGLSETELMALNKGVKDPNKVVPGTQIRTRK